MTSRSEEYNVPFLHGLDSSDAIEEFLENRAVWGVELRRWPSLVWWETRLLWILSWASIIVSVFNYMLSFATLTFTGHLSALELLAPPLLTLESKVSLMELWYVFFRICTLTGISGVAIGSGWQAVVAYVNLATYYIIGLPIGCVLGFKTSLGVAGIWWGMIIGVLLQTITLIILTARTNWNVEVERAAERLKRNSDDAQETLDLVASA